MKFGVVADSKQSYVRIECDMLFCVSVVGNMMAVLHFEVMSDM